MERDLGIFGRPYPRNRVELDQHICPSSRKAGFSSGRLNPPRVVSPVSIGYLRAFWVSLPVNTDSALPLNFSWLLQNHLAGIGRTWAFLGKYFVH